MKTPMKNWVYLGVNVYPADRNSSGIRWHTIAPNLRADTKSGMRELIREQKRLSSANR